MACGDAESPQNQEIVVKGADATFTAILEKPEGIEIEDPLVAELRGKIEGLQAQLKEVETERDDYKEGFQVHFDDKQKLISIGRFSITPRPIQAPRSTG